jgi:chaperonin cofactor prefoldin
MNVEAEIRDLKRRVSQLEGSFGFELLTRELRGTHKDLLAFQEVTEARFDRLDDRFDRLDGKLDALDSKIDAKVDGLSKGLSGIVADALSNYEIKSKKK